MHNLTGALTPVFKRFGGGKGRAIDGRNIFFCFPIFFQNRSGISDFNGRKNKNLPSISLCFVETRSVKHLTFI